MTERKKDSTPVTAERVRELMHYDSETGVFTRKVSAGRGRVGTVAGTPHGKGYLTITVDGRAYKAHRLAWLCVYGEWPKQQIDHINRVKSDNRIANLRDVSPQVNSLNMERALSHNRTGYLGVRKVQDKYRAIVRINKRTKSFGYHDTAEAAHEAYMAAKRKMGVVQ